MNGACASPVTMCSPAWATFPASVPASHIKRPPQLRQATFLHCAAAVAAAQAAVYAYLELATPDPSCKANVKKFCEPAGVESWGAVCSREARGCHAWMRCFIGERSASLVSRPRWPPARAAVWIWQLSACFAPLPPSTDNYVSSLATGDGDPTQLQSARE